MSERVPGQGARKYLGSLVSCILFPLAILNAKRTAKRHTDVDPRAGEKVLAAGVLGIVLMAGAAFLVYDFQMDGEQGMRNTLATELSAITRNSEYEQLVTAGDESASELEANAQFFQRLEPLVLGNEIRSARAAIETSSPDIEFDREAALARFDVYDNALRGQFQFLLYLVYPGLVGLLFAPLVFQLANQVNKDFEESRTVGYKKYPGGAAALFLAFGAFGVPALFFSAKMLQDLHSRSLEGQISL